MDNFDKQPMVVVVSESLDPRVKRQLTAQLSSVVMNVNEVDAELKQMQAMEGIKQQADAESDKSQFDDNAKSEPTPEPIENNPDNNNNDNSNDSNTNNGGNNDDVDNNAGNDENQNQNNDDQNTFADDGDNPFDGNDGGTDNDGSQQSDNQNQPDQNAGNNNNNNQSVSNDQNNNQNNDQKPAEPMAGNNNNENDDEVFNDPTFESVYSAIPKREDASVEIDPPPMKRLLYIPGSDRGVDDRTNIVVQSIEDPENTVVILDLSDVGEVQAKIEFNNVKKQMQDRNIMVFDSIDEATDYLNDAFEQLK